MADISAASPVRVISREDEVLRITNTGYIMASIENLEFVDTIDGAAVNTNLWVQSSSNMTITQTNNSFLNLNPTNVTTANSYAIISSVQQFTNANTNPIYLRWSHQSSLYNMDANAVMEVGWGAVATNAAPTDGVLLRFTNGTAALVINNGGTELVTPFMLPSPNVTDEYFMYIYGTRVKFYMNNVKVLDIPAPTGLSAVSASNRQPAFCRVYTKASISAATPTFKLGQLTVQNINSPFNKPHNHRLVGYGRGSWQNPSSTFGQLANYANSAAPASATLSNTAAGYTTLGGQWQFAAVAGAETDYALFGFQVPAGLQLYISDIHISSLNTVVAVATTPTVLQWAIGINSSAVSLATADGTGTWARRTIALGIQNFPIGAAVGAQATDIVHHLQSPICVEGGRFVHIILKMPIATNTATEIFRGTVGINGWFE